MPKVVRTDEDLMRLRALKRTAQWFSLNQEFTLVTTRFNNATWAANKAVRDRNPAVKTVYACMRPLPANIPADINLFVLEMNNSTNQLLGIGLVRNRPVLGKYAIHHDPQYQFNQYVFLGKMRIDRTEMDASEQEFLRLLEGLCFFGSMHSKRGSDMTRMPAMLVYRCAAEFHINLGETVAAMFRRRMQAEQTRAVDPLAADEEPTKEPTEEASSDEYVTTGATAASLSDWEQDDADWTSCCSAAADAKADAKADDLLPSPSKRARVCASSTVPGLLLVDDGMETEVDSDCEA
jgi:hypothetical protein